MNATTQGDLGLARKLSAIHAELPVARYLPGEVYTSEKIAELEKARIFMTHWLCVGRIEELPEVGDYLTARIMGEPIIVVRETDANIVAFMNMCLHRGVEIAQGTGNTKRFQCPYHSWTYDCGGRLCSTPLMENAGDVLSTDQLPQLRTAIWRGWIFINFDENAATFEQYIEPFESELWYYRTEECRLATKIEFTVDANWKFIAENILDFYHLRTVHAGTFGKLYKVGNDPLPAKLLPNGGGSMVFASSLRNSDPNLPFPRLPWLKESAFSGKGMIFPNINFWCGADSLRMWHMWPISPSQTHAVCYVMLPEDSFAVPEFEAKLDKYREYVRSVIEEDRVALESLQNAAGSGRFEPGPLSHLELMLHHLMSHYASIIASPTGQASKP